MRWRRASRSVARMPSRGPVSWRPAWTSSRTVSWRTVSWRSVFWGARTQASTASTAPLRIDALSKSMPDNRVCAENGTKRASIGAMSRPRMSYFSFARTTIDRPSGVSSANDESCAASASSRALIPVSGMNSVACRLPRVIVPVLSSSSVSTSPAASTARPDIARTLKRTSRSMPAIPIADSSAPIVVGISAMNSATRITTEIRPPA